MFRQEFQDIVNDVIGVDKTGHGKKAVVTNKLNLEVRWCSGGQSGGNCWDDDDSTHYYSIDGEPEEDFWELDSILERVCPAITYLQFRKLEKLIEHDSEREDDYYGNYTNYSIKRLSIEKLWDFLVETGYGKPGKMPKQNPHGFD